MPRELPHSIKALKVPQPEFDYFQEAARRPFGGPGGDVDLNKAWWFAELSLLSYTPENDAVSEILRGAGFEGATYVSRKGSHGMLVHDAEKVVLTFRGTNFNDPDNIIIDARVKLVPHGGAGRVHDGFLAAVDRLWPDLEPRLEKLTRDRDLWICGHSLGGAMATIAAARLPKARALYTFGSPRVGDQDFVDSLVLPTWRFVNEYDWVVSLPPPLHYRHVGITRHLRRDGGLGDGAHFSERILDTLTRRFPQVFKNANGPKEIWRNMVRENALADHAPVNYVLRLWNLTE